MRPELLARALRCGHRADVVPPPPTLPFWSSCRQRYVVLGFAGLGALGATLIFTVSMSLDLLSGARPDKGLVTGSALDLMIVCYAPILVWGPLVAVAVLDYARRTRRSATGR